MMGHASIVRLLIDKGANVFQYKDLLIAATLGGNDKIVELILSKGCCLNSVDIEGKTALFIACEEGNTNIEKLLIDTNADIYIVDSDGRTPLHAACCVGNNDIVRMLINKNADVNMLDVDLETPLHKSCRKGSVDVILTLLDNGADTKQTNKDGHTPVHLAKTEGKIVNESILKALGEDEVGPYQGASMAVSKNDKCQIQITACTSTSVEDGWTPLYQACVLGDLETVQSLIRYGASVNMQTISGEMPLNAACQHGYGFIMQTLLDERADINQALVCAVQKDYDRAVKILLYKGGDFGYKGVDGKSLIKLACEHGSIKAIKILSDKGADFTEIDVNGRTLIHVACNTNSVELIQFLIDKGLDLGIPDKYGRFALFVSIDKGFYDLSKYLVQTSCPISISEEDTKTALISVFESGNKELSQLLVSNGYTEKLSNFNETMLYYACRLNLCDKVMMLLKVGTDINKRYKYGYTPIILADIGGNDYLSNYLQNHKCSDNRTGSILSSHKSLGISNRIMRFKDYENDYSFSELYQACISGAVKSHIYKIIYDRVLVNCFFSPNESYVSTCSKQTPLCLACTRGHSEVVKLLLENGANVDLTVEDDGFQEDDSLSLTIRYGYTPLFAACQRKYYKIVEMLLESGADVNKALYDACREGYLDTVKKILQKGADVNSIGRFGQTPLYSACIGGYSTIVEFLIDQGAIIESKVQKNVFEKRTCLHAAYLYCNHDIVQLLIKKATSVDTFGSFGRHLIHQASGEGNYKIVQILIDKGVNVNASDENGSTPLMVCVLQSIKGNHREYYYRQMEKYNSFEDFGQLHEDYPYQLYKQYNHFGSKPKLLTKNHYKVIQLLIENGADFNQANKQDMTPLSLAMKIGDMKLTDFFLPKESECGEQFTRVESGC